jgi:hypothetical protein
MCPGGLSGLRSSSGLRTKRLRAHHTGSIWWCILNGRLGEHSNKQGEHLAQSRCSTLDNAVHSTYQGCRDARVAHYATAAFLLLVNQVANHYM